MGRCVYLAVATVVCDGIGLGAVISGEHLGEFARDPSGQRVDFEQGVQQISAGVAALKNSFGHGRVDRVLAAMTHP